MLDQYVSTYADECCGSYLFTPYYNYCYYGKKQPLFHTRADKLTSQILYSLNDKKKEENPP